MSNFGKGGGRVERKAHFCLNTLSCSICADSNSFPANSAAAASPFTISLNLTAYEPWEIQRDITGNDKREREGGGEMERTEKNKKDGGGTEEQANG